MKYRFSILIATWIACLAFAMSSEISAADLAQAPVYPLYTVEFQDLIYMKNNVIEEMVNILKEVGILQIHGIPKFGDLRREALQDLATCLDENNEVQEVTMDDGNRRRTTAAETISGLAGSMNSKCGAKAERLRSAVDAATQQMFKAFDNFIATQSGLGGMDLMTPYTSFSSLMSQGNHLEHLHTYYASDSNSESSQKLSPTIDFHTDSGLMIAMTSGFYDGESASDMAGLYIELADGSKRKVSSSDDSLIIMVGEGGESWLLPVLGASLRAVPHAMISGLDGRKRASRSWFGKMFLPPRDAIIFSESIIYGDYRNYELTASGTAREYDMSSNNLPTACGSRKKGFRFLAMNCPSGTIHCWMQCQSVANLPCGQNAYCAYPNGDQRDDDVPNQPMCPSCVPRCPNITDSNPYCQGDGTDMYMDGFHSIASEDDGSLLCLNLFFTTWTLNSKSRYVGACFGVLCLGVLIQYVSKVRMQFAKTNKKTTNLSNFLTVAYFAVQVVLSYFIMLVAMTYSAELFAMVCCGLTIGFAIFNIKIDPSHVSKSPKNSEKEDEIEAADLVSHNF